jgi:single-stranded-DNA-specific exonuclease
MKANWHLRPQEPTVETKALATALQIPEFTAQLLLQRKVSSRSEAVSFFNPTKEPLHNPFLMQHMDRAVRRLQQAIANQERVLLYGDYDVDGTTAVALMAEQLSNFGLQCQTYIPDRYKEGYGVSNQGIEFAISEKIQLLITLDCGIKAQEQLAMAAKAGIDSIVCDHHQPDSILPVSIVLNPKQSDCKYPFKELSGCGVAFKLLQALYLKSNIDANVLYKSLDLVALSIGADIVELRDENRTLCALGLRQLNASPRPALLSILALASKTLPLSLRDVVFTIAPRINAAGRIASGQRAVDWLLSTDQNEIEALALAIDTDNTTRRALDQQTTQEALQQIAADPSYATKYSTIVYSPSWHKGVVGIVASRLIETHYRPTIVLTKSNGLLTGSARCMEPLNLYTLLECCQEHLIQFGGHQFAAGLTLAPASFNSFKIAFDAAVQKQLNNQMLVPKIKIDTELLFLELGSNPSIHFTKILQILAAFEPCGPGNLHPIFITKNCYIQSMRVLKEAHLKLVLVQDGALIALDAIGFQMAHFESQLAEGVAIDIVFQITSNTYRSKTTLQLLIQDLCLSA